jgi:hypothetical protein
MLLWPFARPVNNLGARLNVGSTKPDLCLLFGVYKPVLRVCTARQERRGPGMTRPCCGIERCLVVNGHDGFDDSLCESSQYLQLAKCKKEVEEATVPYPFYTWSGAQQHRLHCSFYSQTCPISLDMKISCSCGQHKAPFQ